MKKFFICLANSKKYGQRCIAGIELVPPSLGDTGYTVMGNDFNSPIWVRPISHREHGAIASGLADHVRLFDVIEVQALNDSSFSQGYQSENVMLLDEGSLRVVDKIVPDATLLGRLLSVESGPLFGNNNKAVSARDIASVHRSLVFIRPPSTHIYFATRQEKTPQLRADFLHEGIQYDLPVTDIDFEKQFKNNPKVLESKVVYLTISLGVEFNGEHWKLVAGVVCI